MVAVSPCPAVTWAVVLTHHLLALHPVLAGGQLAAAATEHLSPPRETVPRARRGEQLQDGSLATGGGKGHLSRPGARPGVGPCSLQPSPWMQT